MYLSIYLSIFKARSLSKVSPATIPNAISPRLPNLTDINTVSPDPLVEQLTTVITSNYDAIAPLKTQCTQALGYTFNITNYETAR